MGWTLKSETAGSSEMLVLVYQTTCHHIPKDGSYNIHCLENLKSHNLLFAAIKLFLFFCICGVHLNLMNLIVIFLTPGGTRQLAAVYTSRTPGTK
jgi:hypothetical protein